MTRPAGDGGSPTDPGPTLIAADPHALVAFTQDVRASAHGASQEIARYNAALMALADQPIDPSYELPPNRLFEIGAAFQGLQDTCNAARGFAAALHQLDANGDDQLNAIDGIDPGLLAMFLQAKAGNPAYRVEVGDLPDIMSELATQRGQAADPDTIRDQLSSLLDEGLIDPGDLKNPLLIDYLIRRGQSITDVADEFETSKMSIGDDGGLNGFGMTDWDPAMLAGIQHALDDDAAEVLGNWLDQDVVLGVVPPAPDGMDPDEWAQKTLARQRQYREYSAETLMDQLDQKGERGFFSADYYDRLLDDYEDGSSSRFDEAMLLALTHSGLHGPTPIYQMTGWDKFKGAVDDAADVAVWVGTGAMLVPGGQIPGTIVRVAGGVVLVGTAVDVIDACGVNADSGNCTQEVALAAVDGITAGKIKLIKAHFLEDGLLSVSEKRILRGLEASESVSSSTLDTLSDGDPYYPVGNGTVKPKDLSPAH
ncbi:hypothetical protein KSP35_01345 [Aquihabitans sp. G128]|uniref:hypothetical protein n=1 Tax=Aquihabitans sp. G128 TaxID=2849779 RepID=UPI001C229BBB|nr:hypothetical protein [Aquihabitans sp. G128]QXC61523.1 hypothetical protein KSP35_01345 [Aquihabitans sp. G128]